MTSRLASYLFLKITFALIITICVAAVCLWVFLAPCFLENALKRAVLKNCPTCELNIDRLAMPVIHPGQIVAEGLHLTGGSPGAFEVDFTAARVQTSLALLQLRRHLIELEDLQIYQPDLMIREGDKTHPHHSSDDDQSDYRLQILKTQLKEGHFKYVRVQAGKPATIQIRKISGSIEEFGTTDELKDATTGSRLDGQIENSGQTTLRVHARFFKKPMHADIDLDMLNQNLDDFTPFFKSNDGVTLKGQLVKGRSHSEVRGKKLSTTVRAEYKDLEVHLEKTSDRDPTAAFFMNLGAAVALKKSDLGADPNAKIDSVQLTREEKESVVHFVLRGIKEASLKVTKGK